jgi:hypothetical protein
MSEKTEKKEQKSAFATKAQTLAALQGKLKSAAILPLQIVKGSEFFRDSFFIDKNKSIVALQQAFPEQKVIIRSSVSNVDPAQESLTGKYLSIPDVDTTDGIALKKAIESVFKSYFLESKKEEVFVQPMLKDIKISGSALTCDINTGTPYYIVNYIAGEEKLQTFIAYKNSLEFLSDQLIKSVVAALQELETLLGSEQLDVEFAITEADELYIFQVGPIANYTGSGVDFAFDIPLNKMYKKIEKLMRPHPLCLGELACYSTMIDCNPAKALGARPKKLAVTLFQELLTNHVWAQRCGDYGYQDLSPCPLLVSLCGVPYVDARASFNSFIPASLPTPLAGKLVDFYLKKFKAYQLYYEKIEHEIVYSCYYFGLPKRMTELLAEGFANEEIKQLEEALLSLTNKIISPESALIKQDKALVDQLAEKHEAILKSDIYVLDKIFLLIEECKSLGMLPYAGAARAWFVAMQFLRSFVDKGIFTDADYNAFLNSLDTVSNQMRADRQAIDLGKLSKEEFLAKYGHVRPDIYNIRSPRLEEAAQKFFGQSGQSKAAAEGNNDFALSQEQLDKIAEECQQNGLSLSAEQLLDFIRQAIEGREYAEFAFARSVSEILNLIKDYGKRLNIMDGDMAHLDLSQLKQLYTDLRYEDIGDVLRENIAMNQRQHESIAPLKLPSVIKKPDDVYAFLSSIQT